MDTQIRKRNKQRGFAMISLLLALPIFAYFLLTMQQKVEELQALSEYQETGVAMAEMVDAVAGFMVQELTPNMAYPDTTSGTAWLKSRSYLPADFRTNYGALDIDSAVIRFDSNTSASVIFAPVRSILNGLPSAAVAATIIGKGNAQATNYRYSFIDFDNFLGNSPTATITARIQFADNTEPWLLKSGNDNLVINLNSTSDFTIDISRETTATAADEYGSISANDVFIASRGRWLSEVADGEAENSSATRNNTQNSYTVFDGAQIPKPLCNADLQPTIHTDAVSIGELNKAAHPDNWYMAKTDQGSTWQVHLVHIENDDSTSSLTGVSNASVHTRCTVFN